MRAYISENASKKIISALALEGFSVVLLPPHGRLPSPVSSHADMLALLADGTLFTDAEYGANVEGFESASRIECNFGKKYPSDVPLNIAVVGRHVFCNTKTASVKVIACLEKMGKTIHHVNQGYAHCSTLILSDRAIITADSGIYSTATEAGLDALKIAEGHISLPPYSYGFIGGASGATDSAIYFCGSLTHHPDGEKIRDFCAQYGKNAVELSEDPLTDLGGILFV